MSGALRGPAGSPELFWGQEHSWLQGTGNAVRPKVKHPGKDRRNRKENRSWEEAFIVFPPAQGVWQPQTPKHFGKHWQEGLEKRNSLSAHARPLCCVRSRGVGLTTISRRLSSSSVPRLGVGGGVRMGESCAKYKHLLSPPEAAL